MTISELIKDESDVPDGMSYIYFRAEHPQTKDPVLWCRGSFGFSEDELYGHLKVFDQWVSQSEIDSLTIKKHE